MPFLLKASVSIYFKNLNYIYRWSYGKANNIGYTRDKQILVFEFYFAVGEAIQTHFLPLHLII